MVHKNISEDKMEVVLRGFIAQKLAQEAEQNDTSIEEYLLDILTRKLDPNSKARQYINAAQELLDQAKQELEKNNLRQAAEKIWGAAALAVKAYAYWKEGRRLTSHRELWQYSEKLAKNLGGWVLDAWLAANSMHACFYEGWCTKAHIEKALDTVHKLVVEVGKRIQQE